MPLKLIYGGSGNPVDLTDCTEIVVNLLNADGSIAQLKLSLGGVSIVDPPILGQFTANLTSQVSALLNVGELQSVDVTLTISGSAMTVRFYNALSVFEVD